MKGQWDSGKPPAMATVRSKHISKGPPLTTFSTQLTNLYTASPNHFFSKSYHWWSQSSTFKRFGKEGPHWVFCCPQPAAPLMLLGNCSADEGLKASLLICPDQGRSRTGRDPIHPATKISLNGVGISPMGVLCPWGLCRYFSLFLFMYKYI